MRAGLVLASTLAAAGVAAAELSTPARVTLDGVGGARPGMNVAAVSAEWGVPLRPNYDVRPTCGTARIERPGIVGQAIFMPRGRFGAVFFRNGALAPHWELRVDVSAEKRVTQIAFGERASVRLDEGCA